LNRTIQILAWGIAGALLTGVLTGAAVAVAGNGIATPVRPFSLASNRVDQPVHEAPDPHNSPGHDQGAAGSGEGARPGDVHGGDGTSGSNSGPGSGSSGSGSDGSGEDSGGSGSDNGGSDNDGDGGDDDD